jgi:hypothetical protein
MKINKKSGIKKTFKSAVLGPRRNPPRVRNLKKVLQ